MGSAESRRNQGVRVSHPRGRELIGGRTQALWGPRPTGPLLVAGWWGRPQPSPHSCGHACQQREAKCEWPGGTDSSSDCPERFQWHHTHHVGCGDDKLDCPQGLWLHRKQAARLQEALPPRQPVRAGAAGEGALPGRPFCLCSLIFLLRGLALGDKPRTSGWPPGAGHQGAWPPGRGLRGGGLWAGLPLCTAPPPLRFNPSCK